MKTTFLRALFSVCCVAILFTMFGTVASAHTFSEKGLYTPFEEPTLRNYTWSPLEKVTGTQQTPQYFIIETVSGGYAEELYISFPAEGGFRLQSKHQYQDTVEESNVGLFEPSSIAVIDYVTDASGAVVMKGADGTVVRYMADGDGFCIDVLDSEQSRIVYLTNWQISFGHKANGTVVRTMVEMPLEPEKEAIYNGSNRYTTPNVVGQHFSLTNKDCFSNADHAYGNIALFHSNRGYSLWFNMTYPGEADFGHADKEKYAITFSGDKLDLYLWTGTPLENIKKYTDLTGTSGMTEEWTFGFWTGAMGNAFAKTYQQNAFANMKMLLEGYKENYNFYPEAVYGEGTNWQESLSVSYANQRGIKMLGYMRAGEKTTYIGNYLGHLVSSTPLKDANGNYLSTGYPYIYNALTLEKTGTYVFDQPEWFDMSNPSFTDFVSGLFEQEWGWGLGGAMLDMGENLNFNGTCFNGLSGMEMHNLNSYYYAKNASEAWQQGVGGNDYVLFMRSSGAGTQYYATNFQGDQYCTYEGYTAALYDMISRGAGGFNLYGSDMGGLGTSAASTPSKDLWNRWVTLSTFSPYMRQHGAAIHMPWEYGYAATANFGDYYYLRKNIVPSIMDAAMDANLTSNPIVKGMMVAYPYYLSLRNVNNQYLFCDDFLVCAVTAENQHSLQVTLPSGNAWYNLFTYDMLRGGQTVTVEAPSNFMPIFVKDGSVKAINLPDSMTLMDEMHDEEDTAFSEHESLLITPPTEARETVIYTKEGASEDFRTYDYTTETYVNKPTDTATFTVSNTVGSRRQIVLALGVTAAKVSYDGKTLERLNHKPDYYNKEYGYYVDLAGMTTIYLPEGWKTLEVVKGDAAYTSYEIAADNLPGLSLLFDDDPQSYYRYASAGDDGLTVVLASVEPQEIGRVEVKWTAGFYQTYNIEYSVDGTNWNVILPQNETEYTVSAGAGGVDIIEFAPVKATHLRIVGVVNGDVAAAAGIYEMNIQAPDPFKQIGAVTEDENFDEFYEEEFGPDDWEEEDTDGSSGKKWKKKLIYPGFPYWIIIAAGVLVVTAGILLVLLLRKKKKKAAMQAAEADALQPPEDEGGESDA